MSRSPASDKKPASGDDLYWLVLQVSILAQTLRKAAAARLAGTDVSLSMRGIMETLDDTGPCSVPMLAAGFSVTRQAVQPVVDALVAAGRVELLPNPASRRSPLIRLTAEGQRVFDQLRGVEMRHVWDVAEAFSTGEIVAARQTLIGLSEAFATLAAALARGKGA